MTLAVAVDGGITASATASAAGVGAVEASDGSVDEAWRFAISCCRNSAIALDGRELGVIGLDAIAGVSNCASARAGERVGGTTTVEIGTEVSVGKGGSAAVVVSDKSDGVSAEAPGIGREALTLSGLDRVSESVVVATEAA